MDAAQEHQDALSMQVGEALQECLALAQGIDRRGSAVAHHRLVGTI
jgi:hypothetical protein